MGTTTERPLTISAAGVCSPIVPWRLPASSTLAGTPISTFTQAAADAIYSPLGHTHTFSSITSKPTTIAGYGITDFNSLGDARWSLLAHTHTFSSLTSKPTTIGGYGITDFNSLGDARWQSKDSDLDIYAGITPSANVQTLLGAADYAAFRTSLNVPSTVDLQDALDDFSSSDRAYTDAKVAAAVPYLVYTALLTQSGTDAPVATVLQNTLGGTVAWEYSATGSYAGVLTGAFANVVVPVPIIINYITGGGTVLHVVTTEKGSADSIIVHSYSDSGATLADSELGANGPTYIEVRVPTP